MGLPVFRADNVNVVNDFFAHPGVMNALGVASTNLDVDILDCTIGHFLSFRRGVSL